MRKKTDLIFLDSTVNIKNIIKEWSIFVRLKNEWINGDCLKELKKLPDESVHLIITSPPYHNLRVYSNDPCDLSNCESYEEYYYLLGLVIKECERVLIPGGKFCMVYEDYNYTFGRDGRNGKESLTGDINKLFLDNNFTLFTEIINEKYNAQRAMMSNGALFYRCMKARDTITASNFNFVYVYKKAGDCESIKASDLTLSEWAEYANSVWHCSVNGFKHTTPMSYEMTRRLVKLYSNPLDTVLDCFGGTGTTNEAAIKSHRNAIGIELSEEFYNKGLERFSLWEEGTLETDDSPQKMIERFNEQLAIGKESKENAEKAKEERKILMQKKKDIRAEIKELEAQLKALGVKAKEIKETKENALRLFDE